MATKDVPIEQRPKYYKRMRKSIVCIRYEDGRILGGGAFVEVGSEQLVITAAHLLVGKEGKLNISCYDSRTFGFETMYMDRKRDVALLRIVDGPKQGFQCLTFSEVDVIRGSEIHLIGHPGRQEFSYNIGRVTTKVGLTCADLYFGCLQLVIVPNFPVKEDRGMVDDFRGLSPSVMFVGAKNVHGSGRYGGTGAPFLDVLGRIVGLYSFTLLDEDYAISCSDILKVIEDCKAKMK